MKLITADGDHYVFRLGRREKQLLSNVLRQYPVIPSGYHRCTRGGATTDDPGNQVLLDEAIAAHRAEHRRRINNWLADPARLAPSQTGYQLSLSREDLEWLLQVVNDVRVGSWLNAGCPDPDEGQPPNVTAETAPALLLMELAGHFESAILDAL